MSDEVVISGMSGRFPQADSVEEFERKLSDGVYMIGDSENRIKWKLSDHPTEFGLIRNLDKFDNQAFFFPSFFSNTTDPQCRIILEHAYESIYDAGVNPSAIMGTKTGVYVGCFNYDSLNYWMYEKTTKLGNSSFTNSAYSMANRISYALGAQGPSIAVDTACSSSMYALNLAFNDIKNGHCDAAIVAGSNLTLNPLATGEFSRSGVLTKTGISQPFDKNASGYVRAEACCAVFLQRANDARRAYATIVNCKTNNDGFKREGFAIPSIEVQKKLYESVYEDPKVQVDPTKIDYLTTWNWYAWESFNMK